MHTMTINDCFYVSPSDEVEVIIERQGDDDDAPAAAKRIDPLFYR